MTIGISMEELSPKIRSLLKIIQILEKDEHQGGPDEQASRYYNRKQSRERADDTRASKPIKKKIEDDNNERDKGENRRTSSSSRERRSRRDNAMNRGRSADGRGRTPSPKRFPAPKPPPRDCSSPVPKMVSTSDVTPADQQGWLIDQLRGKKVWCVISDMLFCVFEKEDSKVSKQVLLLPGCKVRQIEFKSASQEGKILNGVARHFSTTKTISGVDKYQFLIENNSNRQKLMFGVGSKPDLEDWISALGKACCVDISSEQPENNENDESVKKSKSKIVMRRNKSNSPRYNYHEDSTTSTSPSYSPAQTLPSRLDMTSFSLPINNSHDVSKDTIDDIRKRLRKDNSETDFKQIPMRVTHSSTENSESSPSIIKEENATGKGWGLSRFKSPLNLLRRKKRSSSADDAFRRRKMFPVREPDTISNPGLSPRLSGSQPSLASSLGSTTSNSNHDSSFASSTDSKDSNKSKKRGFLSRSFDSDKSSSKSTRSSIRKSASDLKDKIFGKSEIVDQSPRSRSAGIKLKDIETPSVSGYLQYRLAFKWTKVWCVLSRGCFYAFRTQKEEEVPVLALVLNQSSVSYVMDTDKHGKKLFAFKITQRHCKSVYICTEDQHTLMLWMKDLQTEAVKVQVDESLAIEIREKRSSQKKREMREMKEKEAKEKLDAKREELKNKRNSCPDLGSRPRNDSEYESESNSQVKESSTPQSNINVYMGDFTVDSGESIQNEDKSTKFSGKLGNSDTSSVDRLSGSHESRIKATPTNSCVESGNSPDDFKSFKNKDDSNKIGDTNSTSMIKQHHKLNGHVSNESTTTHFAKPYFKFPVKRSNSLTKDLKLSSSKPPEPLTSFSTFSNINTRPSSTKPTNFHSNSIDHSHNDITSSPHALNSKNRKVNESSHQAVTETKQNSPSTGTDIPSQNLKFNEEEQTTQIANDEINDEFNGVRESVVDSLLHDDALKYTWSADEDFLLSVIKDKLRRRRERLESLDYGTMPPVKDINGDEAVVVYDGYDDNGIMNSKVSSPTSPQSFTEDEEDVFVPPGQDSETEDSFMEGFLEKRVDDQWIKYWCSLKDGCLCFYVTPNDQISADSTDLTGYSVQQLVDKFQGKRFVLNLTHTDYVDILLSLDSRDELEVWHQSVNDIIAAKTKRQMNGIQADGKPDMATSDLNTKKNEVPSVQNVKHKLLAEMLRQKMELQKMRAARNGSRAPPSPDNPVDGTNSPSPMDDDRIRTLTRLRQRRMSTQIKMSTIQKQLEESTASPKDKKAVFQLMRRKPDLVQSHSVDHSHQSELEQQVKRLSSQLQEIDSSISSHEVCSPRDEVANSKNKLRHSCDSALLKMAANQSSMDAHEDSVSDSNKIRSQEKEKRKEKEVVRSNSIKSSMQQFAHRTFARAHWNKLRKNHNKSPFGKGDDNSINEKESADNNSGSKEKPPDVIDVTGNNNNDNNNGEFPSQDWSIYAPPDSFRTDDCNIATDQNGTPTKKHRTPKERILSKLSSSHSFTHIDKFASRLKPSSSSSSLFKLLSKNDNKKALDSQSNPSDSPRSIPRLNLNFDPGESDSFSSNEQTPSPDIKHNSHILYSQTTRGDYAGGNDMPTRNTLSYSARGSVDIPENSSDSPRRENARARSGFYSARTEKPSTNPNRNSWSYGMLGSSRRQVNPNALAEIKAFEEFSSKFLGIQDNS